MITVKQMLAAERLAHKKGIFVKDLMENAGREFVEVLKEKFELGDKHIIIFAGHGNNGGDGFVAAKYFAETNPVIVLFFGEESKLGEEASEAYREIKDSINIIPIRNKDDFAQFHFQTGHHLILVDALLGTGIQGAPRPPMDLAINLFNSMEGEKVAMDIPSGNNADNGEVYGKCCAVDLIIALHDIKVGLEKFKDKTVIVDIGIPK